MATGFVVGGGAGIVLGFVVGLVLRSMLVRMPSRAERLRRERLLVDLPLAADLLAACLRTGRSPGPSIEAIAAAVGGPLGDEFGKVAAALRLGSEPRAAWATFIAEPVLASFGRAMVRVWDSGAPLAVTLERLAADARRTRRARAEQRARAVGVRSAVPLALCFLPAFVLVGVVPLVAGAVTGLLR
ncbi:type II secretion system F family protein [Actinopolymorpha sp. B11F2]|uniref:type II secretion system F family protein n=1 Tax=Actinopolymorpha sp. B11F2 TaxID=3160862 RepID=UPI0032E3E7E3